MQGTIQEKYIPQIIDGEKGERVTIMSIFYKHWNTESKVSEAWDITRFTRGELRGALVEEQGGTPALGSLRIPRITWGEGVPLLGVHLGEVIQPLHGLRTHGDHSAVLLTSIGAKMVAEGSKPWCWLLCCNLP